MKPCPFCREDVRDDASKCRYCGSSLLAADPRGDQRASPPTVGADQVVYVLDKGLLRFAKFVLAVLAIFITVGAVFYGWDIKRNDEEIHQIRNEVEQTTQKIKPMIEEMKATKGDLDKARGELEVARNDIREKKRTFDEFVSHSMQASVSSTGPTTATSATTIPATAEKGLTAAQIATLYDFPTEYRGRGQTVAIIELGGGYRASDLATYFEGMHVPQPKITSVSVNGGRNAPGADFGGADAQVMLDIEIVGTIAPEAQIVVYFADNTSAGFVKAVETAVRDRERRPSVMTISWGGVESGWDKTFMTGMNAAFQEAARKGITVVVAAGDSGVTDDPGQNQPQVDFPASSPWVLACGGTKIVVGNGHITAETAWDSNESMLGATGGGVSSVFTAPPWQASVRVPRRPDKSAGRGIPDIAADADPASGYRVFENGRWSVVGGTAAVAPLWSGLIALLNEGLGRNLGFLNPDLYRSVGPSGALRDITSGNNGVRGVQGYSAGPGWDAVTGWGSPDGRKLLAAFRAARR